MNYQEIAMLANSQPSFAARKAELDEENEAILAARQTLLDARTGIRVGDFVLVGENMHRVAHDWGDSVQLTSQGNSGSFYLLDDGYVSHSGGLEPGIEATKFSLTDDRREGPVWFFSQNRSGAHNGYHTKAMFRVWVLN